jgi:NitT/TauT family transport system permease protein
VWSSELLVKTAVSMSVPVRGYLLGAARAFVLTSLAVSTRVGRVSGWGVQQ